MIISVEHYNGAILEVEFDVDVVSPFLSEDVHTVLRKVFSKDATVLDVWRYVLEVGDGRARLVAVQKDIANSDFSDKYASGMSGLRTLLLLLESPHTKEFLRVHGQLIPKAPAQGRRPGDAGGGIERYLPGIIESIAKENQHLTGSYAVIIANPIPFHASLGHFIKGRLNKQVRDYVWSRLWSIPAIVEHFEMRLRSLQPEIILNCCTANLTGKVSQVLWENGYGEKTFVAPHPAVNWNIYKSNTRFKTLRNWFQGEGIAVHRP